MQAIIGLRTENVNDLLYENLQLFAKLMALPDIDDQRANLIPLLDTSIATAFLDGFTRF